MFKFGAGHLFLTPLSDALGAAIALPTPVKIPTMQEISVDYNRELKMLYGSLNAPVDVAGGKVKASGKIKFADINGSIMNSIVYGQTMTTGSGTFTNPSVMGTIPATPFTITATPPNSGTFSRDLGVTDQFGIPYTRVASAPTAGQYTVNASGAYVFAAGDTGKVIYYSYQYTATVVGAKSLSVNAINMGTTPTFRLDAHCPYKGKQFNFSALQCIVGKFNLMTNKNDDHDVWEMDYETFADTAGNHLSITLSE